MVKSKKDATPFTAFRLRVPPSVPPPGFVPIATVTSVVALVTVFPRASWTVTCTAGVSGLPAVAALPREDEFRRSTDGDVEPGAQGSGEAGTPGGEGVARARLVDAQVGEQCHAAHRRYRGGPRERRPGRPRPAC